uniref:ATP phosphoribosyltransferase n=1 Tax=Caldiarchaeum subterraneum TaxID=311458 RepID=E6N7G2_CALS0|nr:ATP phosphoribosyltransferase [Candidatus Caldarchaeum subterraneum]
MPIIKFAVPKGSLETATQEFLAKAMLRLRGAERTYRPVVDDRDIEVKILRPQEIPVFVAGGAYDIGITGVDWVRETGADVLQLLDLEYGYVKLVIAAPKNSPHKTLDQYIEEYARAKKPLKISTEYLNTAASYIASKPVYRKIYGDQQPMIITPWWRKGENNMVRVYLSFGATEAKPPEEADIIVDASATGITLEQNNLTPIETITESTAILIANKQSFNDPVKREKILDILTLLKGVVESGKKLHIFVNVHEENLEKLLTSLPALKSPTISQLSNKGWYAINTVIPKNEFLKILPTLRKLAQGLVVHEPNLILPLEEIMTTQGAQTGNDQNRQSI